MIIKHELFKLCNKDMINKIIENLSMDVEKNTLFMSIKDCLQNDTNKKRVYDTIVFPESFLSFLRYLAINEHYLYLDSLINECSDILFIKFNDGHNLLEYLALNNKDGELEKIIRDIFTNESLNIIHPIDGFCSLLMKLKKFDLLDLLIYKSKNKFVLINTFMQLGVIENSIDGVLYGIKHKYNLDEVTVFEQRTPIIIALSDGKNEEIIKLLISNGASVNIFDPNSGKYPLDFCSEQSDIYEMIKKSGGKSSSGIGKLLYTIKQMIEENNYSLAYSYTLQLISEENPIIKYESVDLFCMCLEHGLEDCATVLMEYVNVEEYDSELLEACFINAGKKSYITVLNLITIVSAIWPKGRLVCSQESLLYIMSLDYIFFDQIGYNRTVMIFNLLNKFFNIDVCNSYDALAHAFVCCNSNYVKYALSQKMKPSAVDEISNGIFYRLFNEYYFELNDELVNDLTEMIASFVNGGASFNYQDKDNNTILHRIFSSDYMDVDILNFYILIALRFGADLTIKNNDGLTPAELLIKRNPDMNELYQVLKLYEYQ